MSDSPHIYVALPVMDELDWMPATLEAISAQSYPDVLVVACVNQPDEWWEDPEKKEVCRRNQRCMEHLHAYPGPIEIIDRSTRGKGWKGKRHGVGWARKTIMDRIAETAQPDDIILSLDADTQFAPEYFASVVRTLAANPDTMALSVPYYHLLPEDPVAASAVLRYEIYMRYYLLNLFRIDSPYAFSALGSAMACTVKAYRSVGGMTPKLSGEDFYFLQKFRKAGAICNWNEEKVFPVARFSTRVFFGTGPAMIRGREGDWRSYPIYSSELFDEIGESYRLFPSMFQKRVDTPVTRFLTAQTGEQDPFALLRKNFKEPRLFVKACHEKFDGLRILQYLKQRHEPMEGGDEINFLEWMRRFYSVDAGCQIPDKTKFSFAESNQEELDRLRDFLVREEDKCRKENSFS
ncbi:MAG: glycosyltransferase [Bacteroidetes bacterium]|nr:glycosyltransferase [Bacteroidota bacterium]